MTHTTKKIALAGLKLGAGTTTTLEALAWTLGKLGTRVLVLAPADERPDQPRQVGENVWLASGVDEVDAGVGAQLMLVDCPPLSRLASHAVLRECDAAFLTLPTTPHSQRSVLRCVGEVSQMMGDAMPDIAGVIPVLYDEKLEPQEIALASFSEKLAGSYVAPAVANDSALAEWSLFGERELPESIQPALIQMATDLEAIFLGSAKADGASETHVTLNVISMDELEEEGAEPDQGSPETSDSESEGAEETSRVTEEALESATQSVHELVDSIEAVQVDKPSNAMEDAVDGAFGFGDVDDLPSPVGGGSGRQAAAAEGTATATETVTVVLEEESGPSEPAFAICVAGVGSGSRAPAVALTVAQSLSQGDKKVLVLNADPESDLLRFSEQSENGRFWGSVLIGTGRKGEASERGADSVLLCAPDATTAASKSLFARADGVLLVADGSNDDVRALHTALHAFSEEQAANAGQRLLGVCVAGGEASEALVECAQELLGSDVPVLELQDEAAWRSWSEAGEGAPDCAETTGLIDSWTAMLSDTIAEEPRFLEVAPLLEQKAQRKVGTPYVLSMASHKGGTGRTTATLGLAWALGRLGRRCVLFDMNPTPTLHLLAGAQPGSEIWPNVQLGKGTLDPEKLQGVDFVLVDAPPILETAGMEMVGRSHGVVLTTLPDPLAFRTIPGATAALEVAQGKNEELEFLGLCVSVFDKNDPLQAEMIGDLRREVGELCIEPPIPLQSELANWGLQPGSALPPGPARAAYFALAAHAEQSAGLEKSRPSEADLNEAPAPKPVRRPKATSKTRSAGAASLPREQGQAGATHRSGSPSGAAASSPKAEPVTPQFKGVSKRLAPKGACLSPDPWSLFGSRGLVIFAQVVDGDERLGLVPDSNFLDESLTEKVVPGVMRSGLLTSLGASGKPSSKKPGGVHPKAQLERDFFGSDPEGLGAACAELADRSAADALDECDNSPDGQFLSGLLELMDKNYEESALILEEALESERKLGAGLNLLGVRVASGIQFGTGLTAQFEPSGAGAKFLQTVALVLEGEIEDAAAAADELIEFDSDDLTAKLLRVEIAALEGEKSSHQLINRLTVGVEGDSVVARALLLHKGRSLRALGLNDGARECLEAIGDGGKGHDEALDAALLYEHAGAAEAAGDDEGARRSRERLYSLDPGYRDVAERLGL